MSFHLPSPEIQWALLWCLFSPFVLLATRWISIGTAKRYGFAAVAVVCSYLVVFTGLRPGSSPTLEVVSGTALILTCLIFILGFWGLLTRGYSIAMLIALERLGGSASHAELIEAYSGGRGLHWMADKRLRGLQAFGLVVVRDGWVIVTPLHGRLALWLYRVFMKLFRLPSYG